MRCYADSSLLTALYIQEARSFKAVEIVNELVEPLLFTNLHRHEVRNAIRLSLFRSRISQAEYAAAIRMFDEHEQAGLLRISSLAWIDVFDRAETVSAAHSARLGTRALDVLHVASALILRADVFYTADQAQAALGRSAGLNVVLLS